MPTVPLRLVNLASDGKDRLVLVEAVYGGLGWTPQVRVHVFNLASHKRVAFIPGISGYALDIRAGCLATLDALRPGGQLRLYDLSSGRPFPRLAPPARWQRVNPSSDPVVTQDCRSVVSWLGASTLGLWDVQTGRLRRRFTKSTPRATGHFVVSDPAVWLSEKGRIRQAAFTSSGHLVPVDPGDQIKEITGAPRPGLMAIRYARAGIRFFASHTGETARVSWWRRWYPQPVFDPSGRWLLRGRNAATVHDLRSGRTLLGLAWLPPAALRGFAAAGDRFFVLADGLRLYSLPEGRLLRRVRLDGLPHGGIDPRAEVQVWAAGSRGTAMALDLRYGHRLETTEWFDYKHELALAAATSAYALLAVVDDDRLQRLYLFDRRTGRLLRRLAPGDTIPWHPASETPSRSAGPDGR